MILPRALPYRENALEPWVSAATMRLHYALYEGYIRRVNLARLGDDPSQALDQALRMEHLPLIRDVKQVMNHEFLWASMAPAGASAGPSQAILDLMQMRWGSPAAFFNEFDVGARSVFGSGWAWVVVTPEGLDVRITQDAEQPREPALLVLDMWEHAYVCDYGTHRGDYVHGFLAGHANWDGAQRRLEALL